MNKTKRLSLVTIVLALLGSLTACTNWDKVEQTVASKTIVAEHTKEKSDRKTKRKCTRTNGSRRCRSVYSHTEVYKVKVPKCYQIKGRNTENKETRTLCVTAKQYERLNVGDKFTEGTIALDKAKAKEVAGSRKRR